MIRIRSLSIRLAIAAGIGAFAAGAAAQDSQQSAVDPVDPKVEEAAWQDALREMLPMSPEQIRELRGRETEVQRASKSREAPGVALSEAVQVSMEPGGRSPVVTLFHGFVSAIEVLDATGQPWPVVEARQGDDKAIIVSVVGDESGPGNVITVAPSEKFTATNLILVLQDASRPVSLILKAEEATAQSELRDRVTLIMGGSGPNAQVIAARGFDHLDADEALRNVLVGQSPTTGGTEIIGGLPPGMRVWRDGNMMWLRTRDTLISPAPDRSSAMGDVRAFRAPFMPVIVISQNGALHTLNLSGRRSHDG